MNLLSTLFVGFIGYVFITNALKVVDDSPSCTDAISAVEYSALYAFFESTNGIHWAWKNDSKIYGNVWSFVVFANGSLDVSFAQLTKPCSELWQGLTCNNVVVGVDVALPYCEITEIDLASYNLTGSLPSTIGKFQNLTFLNLEINNIAFAIPTSIGDLLQLNELHLASNHLTGWMPSEIGNLRNLSYLELDQNSLSGSVPSEIGLLTSMISLDIAFNSFSSQLPLEIGDMGSNVQYFYINNNYFSGEIPSSLAKLASAGIVWVTNNYLSSTIPSEIGLMKELLVLLFDFNELTGSIPTEIGNCRLLIDLDFSSNHLSSTVPKELSQLNVLIELVLHTNSLTGRIPSEFAQFAHLQIADLAYNLFSSTLPTELALMQTIYQFDLSNNLLTGTFCSSLSSINSLTILQLEFNWYTGPLPTKLSLDLTYLSVTSNFFEGTFPEALCTDNEFVLLYLYLGSNLITGNVPSCIFDMKALLGIEFEFNFLTGPIPTNMGLNSKSLTNMYIYSNFITGTIPTEFGYLTDLQFFAVQDNMLTGTIPLEFQAISMLTDFYLYDNLLTGSLPTHVSSSIFEYFLGNNYFDGTIPAQLGNLSGLLEFDVGGNYLSGPIPAALSDFFILSLFYCNDNMLTGDLNEVFADDSHRFQSLAFLDVSDNGFTGSFPSAVLTYPLMTQLTASSNCFSGKISCSSIFDHFIPLITQLYLTNLNSGVNCRRYALPKSIMPNPGFWAENQFGGTIPSCFWKFSLLEVLYLSGNGLTGPISPETVTSGSNEVALPYLKNFSVANNQLTGTIPLSIQLHNPAYVYFDASSNRLTGTIHSNFSVGLTYAKIISTPILFNNRLSGHLDTAQTWPNLLSNVLDSNIFVFPMDDIPPDQRAEAQLVYGSSTLNIAMFTASPCLLLAVVVMIVRRFGQSSTLENSSSNGWASLWLWESKLLYGSDTKLLSSFQFIESIMSLTRFVLFASFATVISLIVSFAIFKDWHPSSSAYSTVVYQYNWTISIAYLHYLAPVLTVMACLVFLLIACGTAGCLLLQWNQAHDAIEKPLASEKTSIFSIRSWGTNICMLACILVNSIAIIAVNTGYLVAVLDKNKHIAFIQFLLSLFKVTWNSVFIPNSVKFWHVRDTPTLMSPLLYHFALLVYNFVLVPCLVTLFVSDSCFLELFQQQPAPYLYHQSCPFINTYQNGTEECAVLPLEEATQYPAFVYNYGCSSALITDYVPVLLYYCFISGFCAPLVMLLLILWPKDWCLNSVALFLRQRVMRSLWPVSWLADDCRCYANRVLRVSNTRLSDLPLHQIDSAGSFQMKLESALEQGDKSSQGDSFNYPASQSNGSTSKLIHSSETLISRQILNLTLFFTFGLAFPYLGIIILCSTLLQIWLTGITLGRYKSLFDPSNAQENSDNLCSLCGKDAALRQQGRVDSTLNSLVQCFRTISSLNLFWIAVLVFVFWACMSFDMIADVYGLSAGWVTLGSIAIGGPLAVVMLIYAIQAMIMRYEIRSPREFSADATAFTSNMSSSSSMLMAANPIFLHLSPRAVADNRATITSDVDPSFNASITEIIEDGNSWNHDVDVLRDNRLLSMNSDFGGDNDSPSVKMVPIKS